MYGGVPADGEAMSSLPGLALAKAIRSAIVCGANDGFVSTTSVMRLTGDTGAMSWTKS